MTAAMLRSSWYAPNLLGFYYVLIVRDPRLHALYSSVHLPAECIVFSALFPAGDQVFRTTPEPCPVRCSDPKMFVFYMIGDRTHLSCFSRSSVTCPSQQNNETRSMKSIPTVKRSVLHSTRTTRGTNNRHLYSRLSKILTAGPGKIWRIDGTFNGQIGGRLEKGAIIGSGIYFNGTSTRSFVVFSINSALAFLSSSGYETQVRSVTERKKQDAKPLSKSPVTSRT